MSLQFVQGKPYFTDRNSNKKQYKYLSEDIQCEVAIVGGGVTGSILGYYFSKIGVDTVILEKSRIAYGSTSITTALLQYELDENVGKLKEVSSSENIIASYKLGLKALSEIEGFIKEYGNECNYKKRDCILYTDKELEIKELMEEYNFRKDNGLDVEFITTDNNPYPFSLKAGVISKEGAAELDPCLYTDMLLESGEKMGLKVYENTEVLSIKHDDEGVTIYTEYEYKVKAKKVIIATGYNTGRFTKRSFGITTTTYNIVTKPVENIKSWKDGILIRDNKDPYNYYRTTVDNRLIAGGEDIKFIPGIFNEEKAKEKYSILEQKLKTMFSNIGNIEVEYSYGGAFTATKDNLGYIGEDPKKKNQWYCLGYGANGILFAILGGIMLSQLYEGKIDENLKLFNITRFEK